MVVSEVQEIKYIILEDEILQGFFLFDNINKKYYY